MAHAPLLRVEVGALHECRMENPPLTRKASSTGILNAYGSILKALALKGRPSALLATRWFESASSQVRR